jgi:hypothetical protein
MADALGGWRERLPPGHVLIRPGIDPLTPSQADRWIEATAVLKAQRRAVMDGLVDWDGVRAYVWTAHHRVDGHLRGVADVEVRARLPESAAMPHELELEAHSSAQACRLCGRPTVLTATRRLHANPDGTAGRVSCRAASRAWTGVADERLDPRQTATL